MFGGVWFRFYLGSYSSSMVKVFPLNGSKDMNFVICDVTEKDIKEIVNIERASFPTPWPPYFFTEELNLPISRFYCAKLNEHENNMVIGFILSHAILDELHLLNIACHPDYRRRGVATALFRHTLEENPQARIVFLEVREGNKPARSLYNKLGFFPIGRRKKYYSDVGEDAIVMAWTTE